MSRTISVIIFATETTSPDQSRDLRGAVFARRQTPAIRTDRAGPLPPILFPRTRTE